MSIFLLAQTSNYNTKKISEKINELFADDFYDLGAGSWLISADDTAQGISNKMGFVDGVLNGAVIVEIASYHGRANPAVWSWIKDKWGG